MEFLKEYIDHIIFAILGLMSFLSVWFSCERLIFLQNLNSQTIKTKMRLKNH